MLTITLPYLCDSHHVLEFCQLSALWSPPYLPGAKNYSGRRSIPSIPTGPKPKLVSRFVGRKERPHGRPWFFSSVEICEVARSLTIVMTMTHRPITFASATFTFTFACMASLTHFYYGIQQWRLDLPSSCLLYTSPSPRDGLLSRMPSSA